jgi:hypothetical protein
MRIVRLFDSRIFSILVSVALFLAIVIVLRRVYIPESEPLTARLEVIQEIKKYIRREEPVPEEVPEEKIQKVLPKKRVVPEKIQETLERLREDQKQARIKKRDDVTPQVMPRFEVKPPVLPRDFESGADRLKREIPVERDLLVRDMGSTDEPGNVIRVARGTGTGDDETRDESIRGLVGEGTVGPGTHGGGEEEIPNIPILSGSLERMGG